MPKSRRDKKVFLTTVNRKKGRNRKNELISSVQRELNKYDRLYVFSLHNEKNTALKEGRLRWRDSGVIFMCKNRVMQVALGKDESTAQKPNSHLVAKMLVGKVGILMTNEPEVDVLDWFDKFSVEGFARSGDVSNQEVTITNEDVAPLTHIDVPQLRKLGLDVVMDKGTVKLNREKQTICELGDILTPEQAKLLERFGYKLSKFYMKIICRWDIQQGNFDLMDG